MKKKISPLILPIGSTGLVVLTYFMLMNQKTMFWNALTSHFNFSMAGIVDLIVSKNWVEAISSRLSAGFQQIIMIFSFETFVFYALISLLIFLLFRKNKTTGWILEDKLILGGLIGLAVSLTIFIVSTSVTTLNMYNSVQASLGALSNQGFDSLNHEINKLTTDFLAIFNQNQANLAEVITKLTAVSGDAQTLIHDTKDLIAIPQTIQQWYGSLGTIKLISGIVGISGGATIITGSALSIFHYYKDTEDQIVENVSNEEEE